MNMDTNKYADRTIHEWEVWTRKTFKHDTRVLWTTYSAEQNPSLFDAEGTANLFVLWVLNNESI